MASAPLWGSRPAVRAVSVWLPAAADRVVGCPFPAAEADRVTDDDEAAVPKSP